MSECKLTRCGNSYHTFLQVGNQDWKCVKCGMVLEIAKNGGLIIKSKPAAAAEVLTGNFTRAVAGNPSGN